MLGKKLSDNGDLESGLSLLPLKTELCNEKTVTQRTACFETDVWQSYEIHTGESIVEGKFEPLLYLKENDGNLVGEGIRVKNIWGTYQHGLFESTTMRRYLVEVARIENVEICSIPFIEKRHRIYDQMADFIETHLDLGGVKQYLGL